METKGNQNPRETGTDRDKGQTERDREQQGGGTQQPASPGTGGTNPGTPTPGQSPTR